MPGPSLETVARLRGQAMRGEIEPQPGFTQAAYQAAGFADVAVAQGINGVAQMGLNGFAPATAAMIPLGLNGYQVGPTHADVVPGQLGIVNGVSVSGPGVPEPPRAMVAKQWTTHAYSKTIGTFEIFFFMLIDGRIMMYNPAVKGWKIWRPKKPIVLYRGKITLSQAVKAQKMLDRLWKTAAKKTKALKLA